MKRVLITALVLAVIVVAGALLFPRLFPDEDPEGWRRHDAAVTTQQPQPEDAGSQVVTEDAGARPSRATIVGVRGVAQRKQADGRWADVNSGDELSLDDTVRTLSGGSLQLQLGNAVQVRLTARTEVTIRELTERTSKVRIEEGRIVADVNPQGKTVLRVEAKGSNAMAETSGGSFSVISDGRGQVAVATSAGSIKLMSGGESVEVGAGQTARVVGDSKPTAPTAIPRSLFLKVAAPRREIQRERETVVAGKTQPGSLVRVGNRLAQVSPDGSFRVRVPLKEGPNQLEVNVIDVAGREKKHDMPKITVDTKEPEIQNSEVTWGGD